MFTFKSTASTLIKNSALYHLETIQKFNVSAVYYCTHYTICTSYIIYIGTMEMLFSWFYWAVLSYFLPYRLRFFLDRHLCHPAHCIMELLLALVELPAHYLGSKMQKKDTFWVFKILILLLRGCTLKVLVHQLMLLQKKKKKLSSSLIIRGIFLNPRLATYRWCFPNHKGCKLAFKCAINTDQSRASAVFCSLVSCSSSCSHWWRDRHGWQLD